jgi:alanine-glyoxylate transaminase / serine-glyoxylate transaminase / serine-pyruvate transaminase
MRGFAMVTTPIVASPTVRDTHRTALNPLTVPDRLLLGPGPSNAYPQVIAAMNHQPLGHLDPDYLAMMDEVQELLRYTWQTDNDLTYAIAGTGSAAMA